ncbi:TniQ family protein [Embleya hyalina]|uniref:TniQ family protein n=1 Tax=Embleya hyalina TaxID=516124 RepID=UPI002482F952
MKPVGWSAWVSRGGTGPPERRSGRAVRRWCRRRAADVLSPGQRAGAGAGFRPCGPSIRSFERTGLVSFGVGVLFRDGVGAACGRVCGWLPGGFAGPRGEVERGWVRVEGRAGWGVSRPWPLAVRFVAEESTGSFLVRWAAANGRTLGDLLEDLGEGGQPPADPGSAEVYLSRPALAWLAAMTGRAVPVLRRALPGLRGPLLLPGEDARWHCPWTPAAGVLVRACPCCAGARGAADAWVLARDPWRVCLRHRRWTDGARARDPGWYDLRAVPEAVAAWRGLERLERRFGPTGVALVADAFAVAGWWWRRVPQARVWADRERRVGAGPGAVRTAALVMAPEVYAVARLLLRHERARGLTDHGGAGAGAELLAAAWVSAGPLGLSAAVAQQPVAEWLARHHRTLPPVPGERVPGRGGGMHRSAPVRAVAHERDDPRACLDDRTCLPWCWGDLRTRV